MDYDLQTWELETKGKYENIDSGLEPVLAASHCMVDRERKCR